MPVGALCGSLLSHFLKNELTNKTCLHIADFLGSLSLLALIPNYYVIATFRFFLGMSNGINSVIMPSKVKMMCPEQYYPAFSMVIGYMTSTGILIGQLFGIGYLEYLYNLKKLVSMEKTPFGGKLFSSSHLLCASPGLSCYSQFTTSTVLKLTSEIMMKPEQSELFHSYTNQKEWKKCMRFRG